MSVFYAMVLMLRSTSGAARTKDEERIRGPEGLPLLGSSLAIQRDTLGFFDRARSYGDFYSFELLTPKGKLLGYTVSRPEHVRHVLKDNYQNYRKSGSYDRLASALGTGLLTSEGELWHSQRRLAQPAFHKRRLVSLADTISGTAGTVIDERWAGEDPRPVNVAAEMSSLTLAVLGQALMSTDLRKVSRDVAWAVDVFFSHASRRIKAPVVVPESWPTPGNLRYRSALRTLDSIVYDLIEECRRGEGESNDLLSLLVNATDGEAGTGMSDRQLRDEVMTMLIAGHETTATALTWCWYLLSRNVESRKKLFEEVDGVLGGRPPAFEDLRRLRYTEMVFKEALRLFPPAWMIARRALSDDEIGGHKIPAGARIAISPYVTHRDPTIWENPEGFDPERFDPEWPAEALSREFSWYPFGGGPRQCIGRNFAMMEGTLVLATIAQRYQLDLSPGVRVEPEASVTLRPRGEVPMVVRKREYVADGRRAPPQNSPS